MRRLPASADSVRLNEQVFKEVYPPCRGQTEIRSSLWPSRRRCGATAPEGPSSPRSSPPATAAPCPMPVPSGMPVEEDRPLTVDMGLILDGYCSDMTRTFVPGRADARYLELHRLVRQAQLAGMQAIRAGVRASEVDRAARSVIAKAGHGPAFGHALGHGVDLPSTKTRASRRGIINSSMPMVVTVSRTSLPLGRHPARKHGGSPPGRLRKPQPRYDLARYMKATETLCPRHQRAPPQSGIDQLLRRQLRRPADDRRSRNLTTSNGTTTNSAAAPGRSSASSTTSGPREPSSDTASPTGQWRES